MLKESLIEEIYSSISKNWDLPAFSDYQGSVKTYGEVGKKISFWHHLFKDCKIQPGDKIAVAGRNSSNWAEIYLSTITYGATVIPILAEFSPDNVHHIVNHSEALFLFATDHVYDNLEPGKMRKLQAAISLNDFEVKFSNCENLNKKLQKATRQKESEVFKGLTRESFQLPSFTNDHLAAIVYTSGTTGFSKGVMLTHNSLTANVIYAQNNMPLASGDNILSFLPLAHSYACAFEFLFPFTIGCHITFLNKLPSPQVLIKAFAEVRPKLVFLVPLLIEKIYKNKIKPVLDKKGVKFINNIPGLNLLIRNKIKKSLTDVFGGNFLEVIIGGAALNKEVAEFLIDIKFPFTVGYGMTECGPLISYAPWDKTAPNSVGNVINYLQIRIDSDDQENVVGEILVKGENVMQGYYKNQEATETTIEKDGWLHTGDLGTIDRNGFIYIRGRSKNMILGPSGQNIYPEEIEAQLNNLPFIQESLVLENDGKLHALIYPDLEKADSENIEGKQLDEIINQNKDHLNKNLPGYSKIQTVKLFPEEFEKTPTKKIKRYLYKLT